MKYRLLLLMIISSLVIGCAMDSGNDDDDSPSLDGLFDTETGIITSTDTSVTTTLQPDGSFAVLDSEELTILEEDSTTFYLSYDDAASTADVESIKQSLESETVTSIDSELARPWEFLSFEDFDTSTQSDQGTFQVAIGLQKVDASSYLSNFLPEGTHIEDTDTTTDTDTDTETDTDTSTDTDTDTTTTTLYELGIHVSSSFIAAADRPNVVLTLLLDISGSMQAPIGFTGEGQSASTLLETMQLGLTTLADQLKDGDIVNIVEFASSANTLAEGLQVTTDLSTYQSAVDGLTLQDSTNLEEGLEKAYEVAQAHFDSSKSNRVILLTDAFIEEGAISSTLVSEYIEIDGAEGIYFSGLGFGEDFEEAFLKELAEAGKGAYFSVRSTTDVLQLFGTRFPALLDVAARDVSFSVTHDGGFEQVLTTAEASTSSADSTTSVPFSLNRSQYFYELLSTTIDESTLNAQNITFRIDFKNADTLNSQNIEVQTTIGTLVGTEEDNRTQARLISTLVYLIQGQLSCDAVTNIEDEFTQRTDVIDEYLSLIEGYCGG